MTKKILIINGPNLNLLGEREKSKYGDANLETVKKKCESHSKSIKIEIKLEQKEKENFDISIKAVKELFDAAVKIDPDLKK